MSTKLNDNFLQFIFFVISIILASILWYSVVASNHTEMDIEVNLEYKSLPAQYVMKNKLPNSFTVRLFGSAELLKTTLNKKTEYTIDLSNVQRGANSFDIKGDNLENFTPFKILEISPNRILVEVEAIAEKVIALESHLLPLPSNSPFTITSISLNPSIVTIKGPESVLANLEHLFVVFDPSKDITEGVHESPVAISFPESTEIYPPLTNIHYTLEQKTVSLSLIKDIILPSSSDEFSISPQHVMIDLLVPEKNSDDPDYLESVKVTCSVQPDFDGKTPVEVPLIAHLPPSSKLVKIYPTSAKISKKSTTLDYKQENKFSSFSLHRNSSESSLIDLPSFKKFTFEPKTYPDFSFTPSDQGDLSSKLPNLPSSLTPSTNELFSQPLPSTSDHSFLPSNPKPNLSNTLKSNENDAQLQHNVYKKIEKLPNQNFNSTPEE